MKYKSPRSIFPSANIWAEKVAEDVYYAEPDTKGGSVVVVPKTAPIIEMALSRVFDAIETVCNSRATSWAIKVKHSTILNGGQLQARQAEAVEISLAISKIRKELITKE